MKFLKHLLPKKHRFSGEVSPLEPFIAVGDVHGRADLVHSLLDMIEGTELADLRLVFVGDYVDRGEHSADVLRLLQMRTSEVSKEKLMCIRGNHEEMLLKFLFDPVQHGPRWLRYGGLQTMASFQAPLVAQTAPEDAWTEARDVLEQNMGPELIAWLTDLPVMWQTGNVAVVHAGADPEQPIDMQDEHTLIWGHKNFDEQDRSDGTWVVHGHTIVDNAMAQNGRISVDTGAYATGVLSAAIVQPGDISFLVAQL